MRSGVTAREKERAERATLVQQEKLSKAKVLPWCPCHSAAAALRHHCRCTPTLKAPRCPARKELLSPQHCASLPISKFLQSQVTWACQLLMRCVMVPVCTLRGGSTR